MLSVGKAIFSSWKYNINIFSFYHILFTTAYEWDWAKCYVYTSSLLFPVQGILSVISVWVCTNDINNIIISVWVCTNDINNIIISVWVCTNDINNIK
jgi:hypothetical protein